MKIFSSWRRLAWLALGLAVAAGTRVEAQGLRFSATASTNLIELGNTLTYTINATNFYPSGSGFRVFVTNTFPAGTELRGAGFAVYTGIITTNADGFLFNFQFSNSGDIARLNVLVKPPVTGWFTNRVELTNTLGDYFATNLVTQVTNTPGTTNTTLADLAVAVTGPSAAVFSNDWMTYGVSVTNLGPGTATNIILTNSLPPGVGYKTNSSALTRIGTGSNVVFNLGTLASGDFANLRLTVQPTNAGTWTFLSVISTNNVNDTNSANNSASTNLLVYNFFTNTLVAYTNTTQIFNPQNSLMEQLITVTNTGTESVSAARVIVLGLTNFLYNAVGTNDSNPFVVYAGLLDPGQSVNLLLQYLIPSHRKFPGPQMTALAVVPPNLSPPANLSTGIQILGISRLSSGSILIAFPSVSNQTYTVEYNSNLLSEPFYVTNYIANTNGTTNIVISIQSVFSTNWLAAQPARMATANYTQWIDYGPPATLSHPSNNTMRFYRVFLNP